MGNVFTMIRQASLRTKAVVAMAVATVIVPAAVLAWGPVDRPTYTVANPADHITFNSITDNPHVGDERGFVRVKDAANTNAGGWTDEVKIQPGKEYLVQMYVHNNAADNLNLVAKNVRVTANVPTEVGKKLEINGFVSADNATPQKVWDQTTFTSDQDFSLSYQAGSAVYYNNKFLNGTPLGDNLVMAGGAQVGYEKMDGNVPGCFQYAGYVVFKVKVNTPQTANFDMSKSVSKHGENKWTDNYVAQPGEKVDYLIQYKNTGDATQENVVIKDTLPAGMTYVNGSTKLGNGANPNGIATNDGITTGGINIGTYAKGSNAWVIFSATAPAKEALACGPNTLKNVARAETNFGYKEDDANVTITKDCEEPKKIEVCDLTTKKIITIDEKDFDSAKHSKNLNDCKEAPVTIQVCNLADNKIITINEKDFDSTKHSKNLADCEQKTIQVCDLNSKTIVTIDSKNFDSKKHSTNLADCKMCPLPGMNNIPANSPNCVNNPVTTLPQTGIDGGLGIFAGIGLLTAGLGYALSSSRIRSLLIG